MKVLFVAPWVPGPMRPRAFGLLQMLSREHSVHVLCLKDRGGSPDDLQDLDLQGVTVVPWSRGWGIARAVAALVRRRSLQIALVREKRMGKAVREISRDWQPDVYHFNVIRSAGFIPATNGAPIVFDMDEMRSSYYDQLRNGSKSFVWKVLGCLEAGPLRAAEDAVVTEAAALLVSSPADVLSFNRPAVLIRSPHAVRTESSRRDNATLLFVGRMSYQANVEAALWFAREVFPAVRSKLPDARLAIVGSDPPAQLRALANEHVLVTGHVDSVDPYYAKATLAIVPVAIATGVQMKLIQALATGTPVISTPNCATGAGIEDGIVAVAEGTDQWINETVRVLRDTTLQGGMSARGAAWAQNHYSDEAIHDGLRAVYQGLTK